MLTEGMKKVEFLIHARDIDAVIEYLGKNRCLQVTDEVRREFSENHRLYADLEKRLGEALRFLDISVSESDISQARLPKPEDVKKTEDLLESLKTLLEKEKAYLEKKSRFDGIFEELSIFRKLDMSIKDLEAVTFLVIRYGTVENDKIEKLKTTLENRAVILDIVNNGKIFALSSKKGRFALDTELKKAGFHEISLPQDLKDLPIDALTAMEKEYRFIEEEIQKFSKKKALFGTSVADALTELREVFAIGRMSEEMKDHIESTESAFFLRGWLPAGDFDKTLKDLVELTEGRIAARSYEAYEVEKVIGGAEKVPVRLHHGRFYSAFSGLIFSYGAPLYGTLDPTPLVAFFFVLLFSIMFGDVGQGFVGLLVGLLLQKGKIRGAEKWKKYSPIIMTVGAASMLTGFLYGSVFANEELLVPLIRKITSLFGEPKDRIVSVLPSGGMGKLFAFFGFTLGIGVVINSLGLIINLFNKFKLREYKKAIFSKTGLVGAFFFWYSIFLIVRLLRGGHLSDADVVFLLLPLALLFWGEPLFNLFSGKRPLFHEGVMTFVMEGLVEILESISYYISNSVSFLRVGAFALSHAVLSLIVFQMANLVSHVPGGMVFKLFIIVLGNVLIIVLEGLIVSIQVIRLQYYEFFSKFFTESGVEFRPFQFTCPRG